MIHKLLINNHLCRFQRLGLTVLLVLGFARAQAQDAQVVNIQTLGKLSVLYSLPHSVVAAIRNNSPAPLLYLPVTLMVTGANAIISTVTTGILAPGATALVTFAPYPSTLNQGTNTLTVSVPPDANNSNNAVTFTQQVTSQRITQVDETQGFTGRIGGGRGSFDNQVATKFTLNQPSAILNEVKLTFIDQGTPDSRYAVVVYDAAGAGGTPGQALYRSNTLARPPIVGNTGQTAPVAVPVPALAVPRQFYVAVAAVPTSTADYSTVNLATQAEDPVRAATNYYQLTSNDPWIDLRTTNSQVRLAIEASVVAPSTCNPPTNVALANSTANSAMVSFTPTSTGTSYTLIYGNYGFSPTTGGQAVTATGSPVTLTGLQPATRYQVYVRATCGPGTLSSLSEQLTFQTASTCPVPQGVAASNLTATGATITFTGPPTGTGYTYWVVPMGAPAPTAGGTATTGASLGLTGLTPGTTYDFYLRASCGATDRSALVGPVAFTTLCNTPPAVITSFPYLENFDSATAPARPCGVSVVDANQDGRTWAVVNNGASAPNAINYTTGPTLGAEDWFFTQPLQLRAGYSYQLQFRYRGFSANVAEALEVKYGPAPTPDSQLNQLYVSTIIRTSVYLTTSANEVLAITPATTGTYYLGFRCFSPTGSAALSVDDVRVTETGRTTLGTLDQQIGLYPNPGRGVFSLDVRQVADQTSALHVTVSSVIGQTLYEADVKQGIIHPLDLSGLSTGLYLVKVQQGTTLAVRKLLVE